MPKKIRISVLNELSAILRLLDWNQVKEEIEQEKRARIVLIGAGNAGKSTLLNRLKGWSVSEGAMKIGVTAAPLVEDLGFFTLIDLPSDPRRNGNGSGEAEPLGADTAWMTVLAADLILFVLDGAVGLRQADYEWYARLRAAGKPMLVVLNKCDAIPESGARVAETSRQLGADIIPISARFGTDIRGLLLPRIVETQPALATALGREVVAYRREASQRVARRAAILCALLGTEPIPLLDIPFQAFAQTQMILRVAAIYGQPTGDRYSRELVATFAGSALLRFAAQQLAKFVPVGGFLVSAGVAWVGTWTLGQAAMVYFERRTNANRNMSEARLRRRKSLGKWLDQAHANAKEKLEWIGKHYGENGSRSHQR
jgi:small GTP-binding protein